MKGRYFHFGQNSRAETLGRSLRLAMVLGLVLCQVALANAGGDGVLPPASGPPVSRHQPHELLVKFKDGVKPERIEEINAGIGAIIKKEFTSIRVWHLQLPDSVAVDKAIQYYQSQAEVIYAEPNYSVRIDGQEKRRKGEVHVQ